MKTQSISGMCSELLKSTRSHIVVVWLVLGFENSHPNRNVWSRAVPTAGEKQKEHAENQWNFSYLSVV